MIIGGHSIIYSRKPEADRAFLRDILRLANVDVGDGFTQLTLPDEGKVGVYQPRHARPRQVRTGKAAGARRAAGRKRA